MGKEREERGKRKGKGLCHGCWGTDVPALLGCHHMTELVHRVKINFSEYRYASVDIADDSSACV